MRYKVKHNVDNADYSDNVGNYWKLLTILTAILMTGLTTIMTYCWQNADTMLDIQEILAHLKCFDFWVCWIEHLIAHKAITKAIWFHIKMIIMITKARRVPHQRRYWSRWRTVQQRIMVAKGIRYKENHKNTKKKTIAVKRKTMTKAKTFTGYEHSKICWQNILDTGNLC